MSETAFQLVLPLAASMQLADFLLPAALLLIVLVLLRRGTRVRRRNKPSNTPLAKAPAVLPAPSDKIVPKEANAWMVELHELARETTGIIDAKVAALRQLLLLAGEQQQRLEKLLQEIESHVGAEERPAELPARQAATTDEHLNERDVQIAAMSRAGYSDVYIANRVKTTLPEVRRLLTQLSSHVERTS